MTADQHQKQPPLCEVLEENGLREGLRGPVVKGTSSARDDGPGHLRDASLQVSIDTNTSRVGKFEDSHETCAHIVFHSGLLLVRGTVEARGPRCTVVGETAWDLDEVAAARRDRGAQTALDLLGCPSPSSTPAQPATPQRMLADGTAGARLHPYADLLPAGTRSADLRRLGHRSQGSAG